MNMNELTISALKIEFAHNERSAEVMSRIPNYYDRIRFTGNIRKLPAINELIPNQKTMGLMDSCEVIRYEAEFTVEHRNQNKKRIKKSIEWVFVGQDINRIEKGSHYSRD